LPTEASPLEYSTRSLAFSHDGRGILRAWGDPDDPHVLRVERAGSRWRITARGLDPPEARAAVREMFSLDDPIEEFYRAVRSDPILNGSERRFRGLRLPRDATLYEALVHAIIGQQLSVAVARTLERRLIEAAGTTRTVEGTEVSFLPGPKTVLGLDGQAFARLGLSRAKQSAILGVARSARGGAFRDVERFRRGPREEVLAQLDVLPGVGRWTAENSLLRGVGRRDLFLAGDLGVRAALAAYGAVRLSASEDRARLWGDRRYPGWGSYATLYLWRTWIDDGTPRVATPHRPASRKRTGDAPPPTR
jgi:DNA-3-methyladenine glycosylase II